MGYNKDRSNAKGDYANSGKPKTGQSRPGGSNIQWANVSLTSAQKDVLRASTFDGERAFDSLAYLIETGHKLVISPKNDRGFISATIMGATSECPNAGAGVSGEGGTAQRAIQSLLFKLDILDGVLIAGSDIPDDDFR